MFRLLDTPHLKLLANSCETMTIPQGERLLNQGEPGDALYVVVEGIAAILLSNGEAEQKIKECGGNEVIGVLALLSNEPHSASVEAVSDLLVLSLKSDVFTEVLRTNGEISYQILQVVVERFADSNKRAIAQIKS